MPATAQRVAFLRGHQDAVVSLAVTPDSQLLASGAEDGGLCIHHPPSSELVCSLQCSTEGAEDETSVGAVAWHPKELAADTFAHLSSSSSSSDGTAGGVDSSSSRGCRLLFAGVGSELLVLLLSPAAAPDNFVTANGSNDNTQAAAAAAAAAPAPAPPAAAAAAAADGAPMQLQVLVREAVSQDDISSLSVNAAGTYLAAADDTGDVMLFDLQKLQQQLQELQPLPHQQQQQQQKQQPLLQSKQQLLQPCRTIAGAHDPMATAVGFRGPHKPWQLLSGGVDNRVGLWDFSRPKKCCSSWNMQHMNGVNPSLGDLGCTADPSSSSSSSSSSSAAAVGREVGSQEQQVQLCNPPMVHSLAMPWALPAAPPAAAAATAGAGGGSLSGNTGASTTSNGVSPMSAAAAAEVPSIPAAVAKRLVAVARGDGGVAVFDADPDAKPLGKPDKQQTSSSSSSSSQAGGASQPAAQQRSGSSKGNGGKGKGGKAGGKFQQQQQQPELLQVSLQQPALVLEQQQQQQQQRLSEVPPGFYVCLGPSLGGHTLPAAAVSFLPWGGGGRYLVSGGQDGRLLLWDWPAAFAAAAAGEGRDRGSSHEPPAKLPPPPSAAAAAGGGAVSSAAAPSAAAPAATVAVAAAAAAAAAAASKKVGSGGSRCLLLDKEHKRKVNALCCCWATSAAATGAGAVAAAGAAISGPAVLLLVADTAPRISVYRVKL